MTVNDWAVFVPLVVLCLVAGGYALGRHIENPK